MYISTAAGRYSVALLKIILCNRIKDVDFLRRCIYVLVAMAVTFMVVL